MQQIGVAYIMETQDIVSMMVYRFCKFEDDENGCEMGVKWSSELM